jgi:hypothetical protein
MKLTFCYLPSVFHLYEDLDLKISALQFSITEGMHVEIRGACLPQMRTIHFHCHYNPPALLSPGGL